MTRLDNKPYRKTLRQTAEILNVSVKTVRRYLDQGRLKWSGKQVLESSIEAFLGGEQPKPGRPPEQEPEVIQELEHKPARRARKGWVRNW